MARKIMIEIVTPERIVLKDEVDLVIARTIDGDVGILPGHANLITVLAIGQLRIQKDGQEESLAIGGGFLEVKPDKVTVLAKTGEKASEIDVERAKAAQERALSRLNSENVDKDRAKSSLRKAEVRLRIASKRG